MKEEKDTTYYIYLLECADGTIYAGSTNDLEKRIIAHNSEKLGAKYTRARQPVVMRYSEKHESKSAALKREHAIKKLARTEKLALIKSFRA